MLTGVEELSREPAIEIAGRALSYSELREAAAAAIPSFRGADRVAVWAEASAECCVASVACMTAGIPFVPINPKLGRAELDHVLSDSRPDVLLGAPSGVAAALESPPRLLTIDVDARGGELPAPNVDDADPAVIIYTSGTTGRPKGAVLPRSAIKSNLDALADAWAWTERDVLVHALPLFHVHGLVLGLLGSLRLGGEVRHLGRFSPEAASGVLAAGGTMFFGVPTMYHRLGQQAQSDPKVVAALAGARLLVSGSAPLPASEFARIERLTGQRVAERYGMTETLMNIAVRADGVRRPGHVGVPLAGVEVRLVDDDGQRLDQADGETIGEVVVRGPNLFSEYLNRPDATADAFRDGWFFTGDMATRAADGYWRIVGRRSTDLIKTGGYKVGAGEIESTLLEHPAVVEVAVTAAADADLGERIVAWVVADASKPPNERVLIDYVASELAPHKRPREIRFLDELPRNAMGKVIKQKLIASDAG